MVHGATARSRTAKDEAEGCVRQLAYFQRDIVFDRMTEFLEETDKPLYVTEINTGTAIMLGNPRAKGSFFADTKRACIEMNGLPRFVYPLRT